MADDNGNNGNDNGDSDEMKKQGPTAPGGDLPGIMAQILETLQRLEANMAHAPAPAPAPPAPGDELEKTQVITEGKTTVEAGTVNNPHDVDPPTGGTEPEGKGVATGSVDSKVTTESGELTKANEMLAMAKSLVEKDAELSRIKAELAEVKKSAAPADDGNVAATRAEPPGGLQGKPAPGTNGKSVAELRKEAFEKMAEGEDIPLSELWELRPTQGGVM